MIIDCFNGDADGILSLIILRHIKPINSNNQKLITGVKRDIKLCKKIVTENYKNSEISILDLSFDKNFKELKQIIDNTKSIFYIDHHKADKLFYHDKLTTVIDESPDVCTATLIYKYFKAENQVNWAIAAAFGDNMYETALRLANRNHLSYQHIKQLQELGTLVNYNSYGTVIDELIYHPAELYKHLIEYDQPSDVIKDKSSAFYKLKKYYQKDISYCSKIKLQFIENTCIVNLPNKTWAHRVSGTLGNKLSYSYKEKAILIITQIDINNVVINLRAPKQNPYGAGYICSKFEVGGGRESAAGINKLTNTKINKLVSEVNQYYK